jgi:hypothetical protein
MPHCAVSETTYNFIMNSASPLKNKSFSIAKYRVFRVTSSLDVVNAPKYLKYKIYTQFIYSNSDVNIVISLCSKLLHSAIAI